MLTLTISLFTQHKLFLSLVVSNHVYIWHIYNDKENFYFMLVLCHYCSRVNFVRFTSLYLSESLGYFVNTDSLKQKIKYNNIIYYGVNKLHRNKTVKL